MREPNFILIIFAILKTMKAIQFRTDASQECGYFVVSVILKLKSVVDALAVAAVALAFS
jgi:hypothetical protein